ncbi:amidohydrolase family protein [Halobellus ruber]|uniref:Amidohydrolase n=1 Tax=Halobellus ruber TaxID=2761102 RepID=A0A7J9SJ38_9EURY|nr:amidohydrolase family protein [Halobellus ruber]MBB6646007.1 amidohydrolase [Halobellus ruber]
MSQTIEPDRLSSLEDVELIVDADAHAQASWDDIRAHLDADHRRFERFFERSPAPGTEMNLYHSPTPTYLYEDMAEGDGDPAGLYDDAKLEETAAVTERIGVDAGVVNPTLILNLNFVRERDYAVAIIQGYNDWLVSELDAYDNLVGNLVVAPHDPHRSAEEIDRLADEDDIAGIQLLGTALLPPAGHASYDPIYDAAEANGLPISMHTSGAGMKPFPEQSYWAETYAEDHVTQHPFAHMTNATSLLLQGVPERFPDLTFVFQEAGIGYVPYLLRRLDTAYHEFGAEIPALPNPPREYVDDALYWCTQPLGHTAETPRHLAWLVELIGPGNLMFAADAPHPDFDTPEELFDRVRAYFEADAVRGMMGGNAVEVYDIR